MDRCTELKEIVLKVHARNGGELRELDWSWALLDPGLGIDSLDLAEIMAQVEKEFGIFPFDAPVPPGTWGDIVRMLPVEQRNAA